MKKIKILWFDFTHPKEWQVYLFIMRQVWKLKDYDRIEYDYGCVLDHATLSRMSKTNYQLPIIYSVIDDAQRENHYDTVKSDLLEIINSGGSIDDVKEYLNDL